MKRSEVVRLICDYWAKVTGQQYAEPDEKTQERMIKVAIAIGRDDTYRYIRVWVKKERARRNTKLVMLKDCFPPKYVGEKLNWYEICIPTVRATAAMEQSLEDYYPPPKPDVPEDVIERGKAKFQEIISDLRKSGWDFKVVKNKEERGEEKVQDAGGEGIQGSAGRYEGGDDRPGN